MKNEIKIDYLYVLKIIYDEPKKTNVASVYRKVSENKYLGGWNKASFYSVIQKLKNEGYITTELSKKKIPPELSIQLTDEAKDILKMFEKKTEFVKIKPPEATKKIEKKIEKNIEKTIEKEKKIEFKEIRDLDDDEIAELSQSVVYKMLDGFGKEIEEISQEEQEKLQITAEKIIRSVREY